MDRKAGKLVVEGVNRVYKHVRRSQKNPQGGRLSKEMPVHACNVQLVCEGCGAATRVGVRYLDRRRQGTLLQEVRRRQRPGVPAQGPLRQEITRTEHERSQSEKEDRGRTAAVEPEVDSRPAAAGEVPEGDPARAGRASWAAPTGSRCRA